MGFRKSIKMDQKKVAVLIKQRLFITLTFLIQKEGSNEANIAYSIPSKRPSSQTESPLLSLQRNKFLYSIDPSAKQIFQKAHY